LATETAFTEDVIRIAEHPQAPYPAWLQAEVKAAVGDTLKLFLAWDESTLGDGIYIEFTPQDGATNGTLKLYRKDGTQLGTTLQLLCANEAYWHLITACYDPDTDEFTACFDARDARGYVVRGQCVSATVPTGFTAGRKAGYGGDGWIRNYKYDRLWYIGEGIEQPCCVPEIAETQAGMLPNTPPSATVTGGSGCYGNLTLAFVGPYPQDAELADVSVYMPPSGTDLSSFVSELNNTASTNGWDVTYAATYVDGVLTITCTPGESIAFDDIVSNWVSDPTGCDVTLTLNPGSEAGQNEKQSITLPETPCPFTLTFGGETTTGLTETSTAAEIQAALEALSTIGEGNVTVTGSAGGPFVVEFVGTLELQPIAALTGSANDETCVDCDGDYYGYYADECPRTVCHRCGSPSCTVVSESFAGIEGTEAEPGDMPCGWDAEGTDWGVVDGKATGNGEVCHNYDTTGGSYYVSAEFDFGHLETLGDSVTVSLTHGDRTVSLTYTRVVGQPWTVIGYASTNLLTFSGFAATPENGTAVTFSVGGGGALPAPLVVGTTYYIRDKSGNSVKVAATLGGDAIDLTTNSSAPVFCDDPPDRYELTSNIPGSSAQYLAEMVSLPMNICPSLICVGTDYVLEVVTPGPVCVSIIQPTLSGHEDASLTSLTITHGYSETRPDCPACTCKITCNDCENPFFAYVDLGEAFLTAQRTCEACNDIQGVIATQYYGDMGDYCAWAYSVAYCTCTHPTCADKVPPNNKTTLSFWLTLSSAVDPVQGLGFVWQLAASWNRVADPSDTCACGGGNVGYASGWQPNCELPTSLEMHRQDPAFSDSEFCGQTGLPFPNPLDPSDGEGCECIGEWPTTIHIGSAP